MLPRSAGHWVARTKVEIVPTVGRLCGMRVYFGQNS